MTRRKTISEEPLLSRKFALSASVIWLSTGILGTGFAVRVRAQELPPQTSSIVEAARNARERTANSGKQPKIITNAGLRLLPRSASDSTLGLQSASTNAAEVPNLPTAACDDHQAERLRAELQAAQQELDQLRRDLQYSPPVVSGNDLDLQYFRPGNSGFNVGAAPLLDTQPPGPARISEVELEDRIDRLQRALRLACEPPEAARIQSAIDDLEQELDPLQRQFALDQEDYYSIPVTERIGGNPQLDAEQQQIQALQVEIINLKEQLAAFIPPEVPR